VETTGAEHPRDDKPFFEVKRYNEPHRSLSW